MTEDERRRFPAARLVLILGAIGLPLLIAGTLMYSTQLCLAGAVISGVAAVLHVGLLLAGY